MVDKIDRPGANTRAVNSSPRSRSCWVLGFDMLLTDGSAVQLDLPGFHVVVPQQDVPDVALRQELDGQHWVVDVAGHWE